ncbi:MAG: tRNA pseudouridine(38-40) synthase TruA [Paludibacter sp.]|nr:tRNA pseudouridine(38-40) synthase TruA [Paludibacter sp.]
MDKQRYFIYLAYNGAGYHGWQIQPNGISVQQVVTTALRTVLRDETIEIVGAGRTDAGVHAEMMVAHFDCDTQRFTLEELTAKLNSFLPHDISISKIINVKPDAHARFDAVARRYEYRIITEKNVFLNGLAARFNENLDFEIMNIAAAKLLNYSDFTSFSKLHTDVKTNNCTITQAHWDKRGEQWIFTIQADRFLRNMVRAIVGTLLDVGRRKMSVDDFCQIIEAKNRCLAGSSVPAEGLFLVEVKY